MIITTKGRNALKVMLDLAQHNEGTPISLTDIAVRVHESAKYLEAVMAQLTAAELVLSTRGKSGGYRLARQPQEYSVWEILVACEGDLAPVSCNGEEHCKNAENCLTLPLWKELDDLICNFFRSKTLADLLK
jgi:Rrf2 family protein